ncbi:MAG: hypothetical protein ACE5E7_14565 [Anaerolineae bacterium]
MTETTTGDTDKRRRASPRMAHLLLAAVLLTLTACGLMNSALTPGDQVILEPQSEAVLVCSQECADRGQCGTMAGGRKVVFGSMGGPATNNHELFFFADSPATINGSDTRTVETIITGERTELIFYHVTVATQEQFEAGWIAGWCVAAP